MMKIEDPKMDFPTETVQEGKVDLLIPKLKAFIKSPSEYAPSKAPVFYNPVMELNRDLAVLAVQVYQRHVDREISVCEPLAACGAMGIRFAAEVRGVKAVVMSDINDRASKLADYNVHLNKLDKRVTVENKDANFLMAGYSAPHRRFDVVDLDPFGSPVPYLDSAIRALRNGGLLALTATDMAPLCGVHPRACIRKYGGKPLRTEYCHELALRLLAGCLATTAAKYDIGVNALFSHSSDHYVRLYATIEYGAKKADASIKNMGYILHCFGCFHRETVSKSFSAVDGGKCLECGSKLSIAGPLWLGSIADRQFCESMEKEAGHRNFVLGNRIERILTLVRNEAEGPVGYYVVDKLCDVLALPVPSVRLVAEALRKEGFRVFPTHFNSRGIKSNALAADIKRVLKPNAVHSRVAERKLCHDKF